MILSLNEIDAAAKRATRGAGYSWGLAEEAGKATRWLCGQGIDGPAALAALLTGVDGTALTAHAPRTLLENWQAAGTLCPLMAGTAMADFAVRLAEGEFRMLSVASPALILPFAALSARRLGTNVTVEMTDAKAVTDGSHLSVEGEIPKIADQIVVRTGGALGPTQARATRATPDPSAWATLGEFAHRTLAPATKESRLKGAGAGLSDND